MVWYEGDDPAHTVVAAQFDDDASGNQLDWLAETSWLAHLAGIEDHEIQLVDRHWVGFTHEGGWHRNSVTSDEFVPLVDYLQALHLEEPTVPLSRALLVLSLRRQPAATPAPDGAEG